MDNVIVPSEYKLLVVDDLITNVQLLKVVLKKQGFEVATAGGGQEALEKVKTEKPDLILLDVMMPDIDGFEVSRILKRDPESKDIPIIFLTALSTSEDMLRGAAAGGSDYVPKPFKREVLLARIDYQLRMLNATRALLRRTDELNNSLMERDRLHAVIAHDLRSPMGSIKMILNLLLNSLDKTVIGEDLHELLLMANRTTEETFALLENLLSWSKNQMGKLELSLRNTDLAELIQDSLLIFSSISQTKNIEIRSEEFPQTNVNVDIDVFKTIFRNLLSNAVKFSPEGGSIIISVNLKDDMAVVNVTDFGKGIKKEDQSKVLDPNTNFTSYGTKNEEGSGLGLALCRDFTERLGGKLWFVSEENKGSTFSFSVHLTK